MEHKTELNVEFLKENLNEEGLRAAKKILNNPQLVGLINDAWNNEEIAKIGYKVFKDKGKESDHEEKLTSNLASLSLGEKPKEARPVEAGPVVQSNKHDGYYSVVFLTNRDRERVPYLIGETIKQGGKAILKNAYNLKTGEHVALKITRDLSAELSKEEIQREVEGLSFVKRYKAEKMRNDASKQKHYLAQDFIRGSGLDDYHKILSESIRQKDINKSTAPTIVHLIASLTNSLADIHEEGLVHRDLKHANAMVIQNKKETHETDPKIEKVLLIDFGSMDKQSGKPYDIKLGTLPYFAPELPRDAEKVNFSYASDVYAVGLIIKDFVELLESQNFRLFSRKNYGGEKEFKDMVAELKQLQEAMLEPNPERRIDSTSALKAINNIVTNSKYQAFISPLTAQATKGPEIKI